MLATNAGWGHVGFSDVKIGGIGGADLCFFFHKEGCPYRLLFLGRFQCPFQSMFFFAGWYTLEGWEIAHSANYGN